MKKLNDRGFAISAILYTMLVLTVLLMFLIVGLLANRRATLNKMSMEVKKDLENMTNDNSPIEGPENLLYRILANNDAEADSSITPYFGEFSPGYSPSYPLAIVTGNGLYQTSNSSIYYFRGDVDNNYVLFSGYCWRIVRTTKSKGVKVIYNGKASASGACDATTTGLILADRIKFNETSSSTYSKSLIETYLEKWYNEQISSQEEKLENFSLCNDTTSNTWERIQKNQPDMQICDGKINVKIGLLTADEAVYAGSLKPNPPEGASGGVTLNHYLRIIQPAPTSANINEKKYLNINYVTASGSSPTQVIYVGAEGQLDTIKADYSGTYGAFGVRPVISFAPNTTYSGGDGTKENPYVIE